MKIIRFIVVSALLAALGYLAYPWIDKMLYTWRLVSMPVPVTLPMPVADLTIRDLRDTWHASRPPARRHEGIDIFAKRGTPVIATTEGIVMRVEQTALGGNVVFVLGPGGHRHYYAHLDQTASVDPGTRLQAGDLLGYVGNTGNARTTPPHLHYGIYTNAGAINPYPFLKAHR